MKQHQYMKPLPVMVLPRPRSLREMGNFCNFLDQQRLKRFLDEYSYLIHIQHKHIKDKHVLGYYVPHWLCDFFFDPHRSQSLYSASWVINECQHAIEGFIAPNSVSHSPLHFFMQPHGKISDATHLLEYVKEGYNNSDLLHFLEYLSEIHWLDIYTRGWHQRGLTHGIIHWLCTTLVSWFLVIWSDSSLTTM